MTALPSRPSILRHRFSAFGGAACEIAAGGAVHDDVSAAVAEVYAVEARLTRFDPSSELMRLNAAGGRPVAVSHLLGAVLEAALDAFELTGGLVNAAVHDALVAAGYDGSIERVRRRARDEAPPGPALPPAPVPPLPAVLEVDGSWARLASRCALDLGGVAKGWLADRLCERFENAAVNLGGDVRAAGGGVDGGGWRVSLCDGTVVRVRDGAVATSGIARRRWPGGHHVIDPRTGLPAAASATALSVVAADAWTADVLATSALLLGERERGGWLESRGAVRHAVAGGGGGS